MVYSVPRQFFQEVDVKLSDAEPGESAYTQLAMRVLAVISRRVEGWCMYVDAVPGMSHKNEWQAVLDHGDKLDEATAKAIALNRFHPGIETEDLPYID